MSCGNISKIGREKGFVCLKKRESPAKMSDFWTFRAIVIINNNEKYEKPCKTALYNTIV